MESCGMNFIKYILFIFNLIFAISGIGIIAAGATILADVSDFKHFLKSDLLGPPIVLIVAGSIVFIVAFLGCFGAIKESYKLLIAFAVLLLVIFIAELAVGIAAAKYKSEFKDGFRKTLQASMTNYTTNEFERAAWNKVHKKFRCCGVDGPADWQQVVTDFPKSCCHSEIVNQPGNTEHCQDNPNDKFVYERGCFETLQTKLESNVKIVIGVGIGIAFIQIVGIALALWLAYTIKKENNNMAK